MASLFQHTLRITYVRNIYIYINLHLTYHSFCSVDAQVAFLTHSLGIFFFPFYFKGNIPRRAVPLYSRLLNIPLRTVQFSRVM